RDVRVHRLEAAGQQGRLVGCVADIPGVACTCVYAFERFGPLGHASEDDCEWEELGEDLRLLRELLAVFLGCGHVQAETQSTLKQLTAGRGALAHEGKRRRQ